MIGDQSPGILAADSFLQGKRRSAQKLLPIHLVLEYRRTIQSACDDGVDISRQVQPSLAAMII